MFRAEETGMPMNKNLFHSIKACIHDILKGRKTFLATFNLFTLVLFFAD